MGRRTDKAKPARSSRRVTTTKSGRPIKVKACTFCVSKTEWVDYKDVNVLRRLMSDRGKIKARRVTGTCRQHQRDVAIAIKTARELALLPYALLPSASDKGGGGRRGGGPRDQRRPPGMAAEAAGDGAGPAGDAAAGDGTERAEGALDGSTDGGNGTGGAMSTAQNEGAGDA